MAKIVFPEDSQDYGLLLILLIFFPQKYNHFCLA